MWCLLWGVRQPVVKEKLEKVTYPKFFSAFERLLRQHGKDFFCGPKVRRPLNDRVTEAGVGENPRAAVEAGGIEASLHVIISLRCSSVLTPSYRPPSVCRVLSDHGGGPGRVPGAAVDHHLHRHAAEPGALPAPLRRYGTLPLSWVWWGGRDGMGVRRPERACSWSMLVD